MTEIHINDEDLVGVKGKVAIITGGSSGIGLATVELLVSHGGLVVSADIHPPRTPGAFLFVQTDVTRWTDLVRLFRTAAEKYGRIDYVFANAGIGPRADYLALALDEAGEPVEPEKLTLDVNLNSVVNTSALAVHYLKSLAGGGGGGGAVVLMASSTCLSPVRAVDYATAKTGVLGFGRGFARLVQAAGLPIRVNTLAPTWTSTQVLPDLENLLAAVGQDCQSPSVVARAAAYLMVEEGRHGDVIYVSDGRYTEIENGVLARAYEAIKGDKLSDDAVLAKISALAG